jgi:hypothetical protein
MATLLMRGLSFQGQQDLFFLILSVFYNFRIDNKEKGVTEYA